MSESPSPPKWFWIASAIALVWNLMGVGAYLAHVMMSPEAVSALSQAEQELLSGTPVWVTAAFAAAVWAGAAGCLLLLLRKSMAVPILILSLMSVLAQQTYAFFLSNTFEVYGSAARIMPIMIVVVAFLLVGLARSAKDKEWIN